MMAQELAPSDWTQQTFEGHQSTLRGIIQSIDEQLGLAIIAATNYARGEHLVCFLEDIDRNKGWQHGIGEGDNVEFELTPQTAEDRAYLADSYLHNRFNYKLSPNDIASNVSHLENGTVILEELLYSDPRYEGVVVTEAQPSVQHHAFGSYYGDEEPLKGLIRLIGTYHDTQIPPISERYNVASIDADDSDKTKTLLQPGTMLSFCGRDLLTTRIVLRKGDRVEFDVYRDIRNGDLPFGATNIVFLDANKDEKRQHGFIYRFLSRPPSSQYGSDQKFGLIKSTYHEELFWHQSEILDRDELVQIGDEVSFIREIDEIHGRLKASRITFLPKNTIQLTVLSSCLLSGKIESSTSYSKSPLIEYSNIETGSTQLIEVDSVNSDHYILVKGDSVSFRLSCQHENPTLKRAVHVVVTREVDRTHRGVISSLNGDSYGEISYSDRFSSQHSIYFYLTEWMDSCVDLYPLLSVEFNILSSGTKKRAVRVRPTQLPLTLGERLIVKKEKLRLESVREQEIRDSMLNEYISSINNVKRLSLRNNKLKPPLIKSKKSDKKGDNVSNNDSNKSLSKAKIRRMRKQRNKAVKTQKAQRKETLTQAALDNNEANQVSISASNPIPSFDTMIPIEGIVLCPMRSKHGRGTIRYEYDCESKTVEYDYDQKANWQRSIFLTEGDRVRLFFRSINEDDASLAYVALLDPVYKRRLYGICYYYHPTKNYYLQNNYGNQYIELWSYHIVDKKVQSYNLENELLVFDLSDRINYNNDNKIATRCRWCRLDDKEWENGKIISIPNNYNDYGFIKYCDKKNMKEKQIRYSMSSIKKEYRNYKKIGDQVKFHIEHIVTKSTYDVIPPTAVNIDTTQLYRPKSKALTK